MEKINIAELLRDCPTGMELDCMIYEDVYFDYIDELNIIHCYIQHDTHKTSITFNQHGTPNSDIKSKCVIFPKGKTTWKGFHRPFRDGDIIYACDDYSDATFTYVAILKRIENESKGKISYLEIYSHCFYNYEDNYFSTDDLPYDGYDIRFATEEEKAELFKAIKDNGYRWNPVFKTLEKLPKFKIGDRIKKNKDYISGIITNITDDGFYKVEYQEGDVSYVYIAYQDDWELVPDKFDISKLKHFDKVLVRDSDTQKWCISFFGCYNGQETYKYSCINNSAYAQCIPYEGNEHLFDTVTECDNFFKIWEE